MSGASSGVAIADECINKYQELKLGHSYRFVTFKMNSNNSEVIVDQTAPPSASYEDFKRALPSDDCRYAVYDFPFQVEGADRNKLVFVLWAPDTAKIKSKMLYTTTKDAIKKKLVGLGVEIQATDAAEIDQATVEDKVKTLSK